MAAQSLSSLSETGWAYDVFLSFRGENTRYNFTDHLYNALVQVGIYPFRDDEELPKGKIISTELCKAIRGSRIFIVVFSEGYASSTWCLGELAEMVDCCRENDHHILLPIFYHINPSDVRKQTGTFAKAFDEYKKRFQTNMAQVERWREALAEAGSRSGWDVVDGYEGKLIKKIVDHVLGELPIHLCVAEHPIGIEYSVERVKALLNLETNGIRIVGIYGMGGIGKTTIAKAIYNQICLKFEGSSCLLDVQENSKVAGGLVKLQKKILYDILKKDFRIDQVDEGIELIKKRLNKKKIFVVLDDVVDSNQVNKLLGNLRWFNLGSRVIITTRDEHLLNQLDIDEKYMVSPLNDSQSLELFCWHAFKMAHPKKDFQELSYRAVNYVEGLPLALEVLGSFLKGKNYVIWESELKKLKRQPNEKIQKVLRISYDSLDNYVKEIFLDIACFFVGVKEDYATKIFEGCGLFPKGGIQTLKQRSLIITNEDNDLWMHTLIQEMGREIVREKACNILENYSRLWICEDVLNVLNKHMGTHHMKGISLNSLGLEDVHLQLKAFATMKNLRLLQISMVYLIGNFKFLSNELRWFWWHNCPQKFLPQEFYLEKLVILDLQESKLIQVWKGYKVLNKLKVLNLRNSKNLTKTPNFSGVQHLEILILEGCTSLVKIHESIGYLKCLVELNLSGCISLKNLPNTIGNLEFLKTLDMHGCSTIFKLSKQVGNMMALAKFHGNETNTEQRLSFLDLSKNHKIELLRCQQRCLNSWTSCLSCYISPKNSIGINSMLASISRFRYLERLNLSYCGLFEDNFPIDLEGLSSLTMLNLSGNYFCNTPRGISCLPKLLTLRLNDCRNLQSISEVPTSIWIISASSTPWISFSNLLDMEHSPTFCECDSEDHLQKLISSPLIFVYRHASQEPTCEDVEFPIIFLQNTDIPDWFSHQAIGSLISFQVPPLSEGRIDEILICASYRPLPSIPSCTSSEGPTVAISFCNKTRGWDLSHQTKVPLHFAAISCHIYRVPVNYEGYGDYALPKCCYFSLDSHRIYRTCSFRGRATRGFESGDEIEVSLKFRGDFEVHKCGIHLPLRKFNTIKDGF